MPGSIAYLTAQSEDRVEMGGKTISMVAEILYDGTVVKRSESHGEYCSAAVSMRID